jgi:hypothetical protein
VGCGWRSTFDVGLTSMKHVEAPTPLNAGVDAKNAKRKYQGRKEDKKVFSFFPLRSLRSLRSSFASFASTLAFNSFTPVHHHTQARQS